MMLLKYMTIRGQLIFAWAGQIFSSMEGGCHLLNSALDGEEGHELWSVTISQ